MDEMKALLQAILENQKVTHAKLDALTLDVRKLQGEMVEVKKDVADFRYETKMNFNRFDRHMRAIESDLDHAIDRIEHVEQSNS